MQITYRQFPHPVLNEFDNGYKNASFKSAISTKVKNNYIDIEFNFILNCEYLDKLIKEEKASYVVHLECKTTRFRIVKESKENFLKVSIDSEKVNKEIEVCILIVAKEEINDFKSIDFIEDFEGIQFQIDKGEILAHDLDKSIKIEKSGENERVPSIFSITYEEGKVIEPLTWQPSGKKIIIKISKDNFIRYKNIANIEDFRAALANMIIIPVLTEIISMIKVESDSEQYTLSEEEECFRIIENKLIRLGYEIPSMLKRDTSTAIAYKLLGNLLDNSLISLENFLIGDEE